MTLSEAVKLERTEAQESGYSPLTSYVIMEMLPNVFEVRFLHVKNGNDRFCHSGLLLGLR